MKTIKVTFKSGESTVETSGYSGGECEQATAALERALGKTTTNTRTREYHSASTVGQKVSQ